jgi:hypothetical protein
MQKQLVAAIATGALLLGAANAHAIGIGAKAKAKKVQGDLVPALKPMDTGSGTGDDEGDDPAFLDTGEFRSASCTFDAGKFKAQLGKDAAVKLKGVNCGGTPYNGQLCAHIKALSTIMSEDIDKDGASTPVTCNSTGGDIAGKMNFVTINVGLLSCSDGSCSGTLPVVTADPCPGTDKITEVRRVEVFDGPAKANIVSLGTTLSACCGPTQTTVGPAAVSSVAPCNSAPGNTQDVLGEMGTITQGE